jgi:hypothetical protein
VNVSVLDFFVLTVLAFEPELVDLHGKNLWSPEFKELVTETENTEEILLRSAAQLV